MKELNIISYNIHKGFSLFGRKYTLSLIKQYLETLDADLVFLQEVRGLCPKGEHSNQLEHLADTLWPHSAYGKNAAYTSAHHGNAILSRYPMDKLENRDISQNRFERRGILYSRLQIESVESPMHLFCLHLNLREKARFLQVRDLLEFVDEKVEAKDPIIIAGDFNDWTGRLTSYLMNFFDIAENQGEDKLKTYPSFFPLLSLDRIFTKNIKLLSLERVSSQIWVGLSDHLPLKARISVEGGP